MAKKKIKPGQIFKHLPSGGTYVIVTKGQIKIPHVGWFKSVTYKDLQGNMYTRFLEDFENKFIRKPKSGDKQEFENVAQRLNDLGKAINKSSDEIKETLLSKENKFVEASNLVTKPV